jgi:hypothetical protein
VVLALLSWLSLAKIIPDCATSHYRYRQWRLRDQLVDEIRHGEYQDAERAGRFVRMFEWSIAQSPDLSVLKLVLLNISRPRHVGRDPLDLEGLSPDDCAKLRAYRDEYETATVLKAFMGTPSGWICVVLMMPLALLVASVQWLLRGNRRIGALRGRYSAGVRKYVVADFELDASMRGKPREPLHQQI